MGEVRACVYFSVIFLCFQVSAAKPFFFGLFCGAVCEDDYDSTPVPDSWEDYFDWCDCPTRRPIPVTTPMPTAFPNPGMQPGSYYMSPPQTGGGISIIPNPSGSLTLYFNPFGGAPNATPAPVSPPTTAAGTPAAAATTAAPAAAVPAAAAPVTPAAPAAANAAATPAATAAPAARRK